VKWPAEVWVAVSALNSTVGSRPYHREGRTMPYGTTFVHMTLCGCAISYEDDTQGPLMVPARRKVASLFARPCKDCEKRP
jgi:hypothetical protein